MIRWVIRKVQTLAGDLNVWCWHYLNRRDRCDKCGRLVGDDVWGCRCTCEV